MTYDTDLDKVKRIIKQIGRELLADPELAPHIIETLKMQGVEEYGDFAIKIRLKLTCKPGEQFVIRRRAYAHDQEGVRRATASSSPFRPFRSPAASAGAAAAQAVLGARCRACEHDGTTISDKT